MASANRKISSKPIAQSSPFLFVHSFSLSLLLWLRARTDFIVFFLVAAVPKFFNLRNVLYFIWDQGRDAWAIRNIVVNRDLVLVGPTSGMQGFFLGPLWFYVGVPGYILGGGNPYVLCGWYIALACMMLFFIWWLCHQLFPSRLVARAAAYLVAFVPGALAGSTFIWNPLLSLPLVAAATWALVQSRRSRWWMVLGFFLFALVLQSEFAYAIFFLVPLWLLIPWLRARFDIRDFVFSAAAVAVTLVPQALFEWRHNFLMTHALIQNFGDTSQRVEWFRLWLTRPRQLWDATRLLLVGVFPAGHILTALLVLVIGWAIWRIWRQKNNFVWRLISLLAIIPYLGFMVWRGNHGYFFQYYLTPHFIFLGLLIAYGLHQLTLVEWRGKYLAGLNVHKKTIIAGAAGALILLCFSTTWGSTIDVTNNAGLHTMETALSDVYAWTKTDDVPNNQGVVRIFTPNGQTEHYDFVMHWLANRYQQPIPRTVRLPDDQTWYTILEPDHNAQGETRFYPWYREATAGGVLTRRIKVGDLYVETWMRQVRANERGVPVMPFVPPRAALE